MILHNTHKMTGDFFKKIVIIRFRWRTCSSYNPNLIFGRCGLSVMSRDIIKTRLSCQTYHGSHVQIILFFD